MNSFYGKIAVGSVVTVSFTPKENKGFINNLTLKKKNISLKPPLLNFSLQRYLYKLPHMRKITMGNHWKLISLFRTAIHRVTGALSISLSLFLSLLAFKPYRIDRGQLD